MDGQEIGIKSAFRVEDQIVDFLERVGEEKGYDKGRDHKAAIRAVITRKVFNSVGTREPPSKVFKYLERRCGIKRVMALYYIRDYKPVREYYILNGLYQKLFEPKDKEPILRVGIDLESCNALDREIVYKFLALCVSLDSLLPYSEEELNNLLRNHGKKSKVSNKTNGR